MGVTDGTAFSKWNAGLQDRFQKKIVLPKNFKTPQEIEEKNIKNEQKALRKELEDWWGTTNKEIKKDVEEQTQGTTYIKKKIKGYDDEGNRTDAGDYLIWSSRQKTSKVDLTVSTTQYSSTIHKTTRTAPKNKTGSYKGYSFTDVNLGSSYQSWLIYAFGGEIIGKTNTNNEAFIKDSTEGLYYNRSNTQFFKQGKKAFKEYLRLRDQKIFRITGNPSNQQGFIPVELSLTLDGLSGIKIFQKINIKQEFLPPEYISSALTNTIDFVIQKVNHNISDEKWETELVTISIPPTQIENIETIDEGLFTYLGLGTSETFEISGDRTITGNAQRFPVKDLSPDNFIKEEIKKSEGYYSGKENKVIRSNGIAYAYPD